MEEFILFFIEINVNPSHFQNDKVHQTPQHMGMYGQGGGVPPVAPPQGMIHQQAPQMHQGQSQPPPNSQNTQASLPSPLYPWMRSQFGMYKIFILFFTIFCLKSLLFFP